MPVHYKQLSGSAMSEEGKAQVVFGVAWGKLGYRIREASSMWAVRTVQLFLHDSMCADACVQDDGSINSYFQRSVQSGPTRLRLSTAGNK